MLYPFAPHITEEIWEQMNFGGMLNEATWPSYDEAKCVDSEIEIAVQVNLDGVCMIGEGHLVHDLNGFRLTGADGKLDYSQSPAFSHTLYSDYYWYEIADVICIGDNETLYYCFPQGSGDVVAKTRLAVEEMYKLYKERKLVATATDKKIPNND